MVYIHADTEGTDILCKLHLVPDLAVIRVRLYYPYGLSSGLYYLLEVVVLHHADKVQYIKFLSGFRVFLKARQLSSLEVFEV